MSVRSTVERVIDPARQGISHEPESHVEKMHPPVPLDEAMAVIETWAPGYQPFRGFAISRALYQEVLRLREELGDLQRTFDLLWDADMRAIKRWQAAHPGNALTWPDHADMVVWLLEERDQWERVADDTLGFCSEQIGKETERWTDRIWRACQAVPCSAGLADCHAPYYRHFHCCNLRVALWPGEEFPTDYLPDEGFIHLFEPGRRDAPRVSAGCVRLVEPLLPEDRAWPED